MAECIQWWPLAKHLSQSLKQFQTDDGKSPFEKFYIYAGSKSNDKDYPCIEIKWDLESDINLHGRSEATTNLWIDMFIENSDDNPEKPYMLLYFYQNHILSVLEEWPSKINEELKIAAMLRVKEIVSDADMFRPNCACRFSIEINWRGKTI